MYHDFPWIKVISYRERIVTFMYTFILMKNDLDGWNNTIDEWKIILLFTFCNEYNYFIIVLLLRLVFTSYNNKILN